MLCQFFKTGGDCPDHPCKEYGTAASSWSGKSYLKMGNLQEEEVSNQSLPYFYN